tara:strand:+ start:1093 stop:2958 length:1866 start_codon:yes stop_codon:yes gene_type:complete
MSLIICSSTQDEYLRKDRSGDVISTINGLSNPATFSNNFRSPLIIPKDAEVAVESVKINRAPLFDIPDEALFYFYFGPELNSTLVANDTTKIPVAIRIPRGSYTVDSLKEVLDNTLNESSLGPEIFGGFTVDTERNTSLDFSNFTFDVQRQTTKSAITWENTAAECRPANDTTTTDNFEWNGTAKTLTCSVLNVDFNHCCVTQLPLYPLASVSGVLEVDFSAVTDSWDIGLSRIRIPEVSNGQPINTISKLIGQDADPLFDYYVSYNAEDDGEMKIFQALTDGEGKLNNVEVQYYKNNTSFTEPINAAKITADGLTKLKFTLIGNNLNLDIESKGTYKPLVSSTNASMNNVDKRYNFKPTANTTESLFPSFQLFKATDVLTINTFEGRNLTNWKTSTTGEEFVAGSDFYSSHIKSGKGLINYIDNKKSLRSYTAANASFQYTDLNGSNALNYRVVLIGGPERNLSSTSNSRSDTATYVLPPRQTANMGESLGFGDYSVLQQSIFKDATSTLALTIMKPPSQSTLYTNECFIRANNLTGTSYNGAKNSISRILYSLPRFDNAGNTQGNLYFQASEKTYIKLNNTEQLTLNQLDIDLVDRSERIVRDLQGNTIVILYIRKSPI